MNLDNSPTLEELSSLLASCNDEEGHHILWVGRSGSVHITQLPEGLTPIGFEQSKPELQFRYDTFQQGNGYVGIHAAQLKDYVERIFRSLQREWNNYKDAPNPAYIDVF